ncbi:GntR family transcriptional regulator, partial [Pseudonocardia sp. KRD-176]|nr:GntR family transcriptional regulator [Pseudonocardia oceani]
MEVTAFDRHFPGEKALAHHYGVSRHTVRRALLVLRETPSRRCSGSPRGGAVRDRARRQLERRTRRAAAHLGP